MKKVKRWLILFLWLLLCCPAAAEQLTGKVSWIFDGDTLQVEDIGKVRLLGIDTPEGQASRRDLYYRKRYNIPAEKLRSIAAQAKRFNIHKVKGKTVRLEFDHEQEDKYGRKLAYLYLPDGRMLNQLLLEKGWATVFRRFEFKHKQDFLAIEEAARINQRGLWSE